jgi:hypothetical protein
MAALLATSDVTLVLPANSACHFVSIDFPAAGALTANCGANLIVRGPLLWNSVKGRLYPVQILHMRRKAILGFVPIAQSPR